MVERLFLCGLREDQQRAYRQAVQLSIDGQDQGSANVHFRIDEIPRRMAADVPAVVYDLLRLAAYVHAADSLVSRGSDHATDLGARWRRQMRLVVAVQEMTTWKQPEVVSALEEVLAFLTDDVWRFEFVQRASEPEPSYLNFGLPDQDAARSEVILFSGGLDSLAGAVSTLATTTWPVFLVSHQSSGVITNRRNELVAQLANRFPGRVFHVPVTAHLMGGLKAHEYTQRSSRLLKKYADFAVGMAVSRRAC